MTASEVQYIKEKMAIYEAEAREAFVKAGECTWDESAEHDVYYMEASCYEAKANALYWLLRHFGEIDDEDT